MSKNKVKCPVCNGSGKVDPMETVRGVSKKMREAEAWVDAYISKHGFPPSYRMVCDHFNLVSVSAAYSRLRHCREKMKQVKL